MMTPLGDGISEIEVVEVLGNDTTVVNAARVSFNKRVDVFDTTKDSKLLAYLLKHNHWTPFSHPQLQLRLKMPIFVARQWFKHCIGFTRNEVSRRYVNSEPEFYIPKEFRLQSENNKQGSTEEILDSSDFYKTYMEDICKQAKHLYHIALDEGMCKEQARMILPQNMYTEFWETASLAAYLRLINLRTDSHAQKETQLYASAIQEIVSQTFPATYAEFKSLFKINNTNTN